MSEINDWIRKRYTHPVVIVETTALADAICARDGLDAIHLLRRYSSVAGPLHANIGEKGETSTVRNFGVRFQRTDCVREVAPSQILRHVRHQIWRQAELDLVCGEQLDRVVHDQLMEGESASSSATVDATGTSAGNGKTTEGVASASVAASTAAASVAGPSPRPRRIAMNTTAFNTLLERAHPPWHSAAVRDLHHLVRATSFETIDYPIGVLHVVSTNEPGGVDGVLKALRAQLKRVYDMRADLVGMETDLHAFYILLHDLAPPDSSAASSTATVTSPTLRDAQAILNAMKQLYGDSYCALVKLNSDAAARTPPLPSDPTPWVEANPICVDVPAYTALVREQNREASRPDPAAKSKPASSVPLSLRYRHVKTYFTADSSQGVGEKLTTGCFLARDDLMELESTMAYYIGQNLFRFLERRLRGLDITVQDRRTTTLRKVAAWFSLKDESKPRAASVTSTADGSPPRYLATSVEMQMRRCGDLCLAFHHYDMAADYYKMCMEELIQTSPERPYNKAMIAGCQEAIGIALLLQDRLILPTSTPWTVTASWTTTRSHNACRLELAHSMYIGAGLPMCALRLSFLMAEFCRSRMPPAMDSVVGQLKHILRSGLVGRTPLLLALVHDMLASTYIFTNPPYPSGLLQSPSLPISSDGLPVYSYVRRFAAYLMTAGQHYQSEDVMKCALRCFLRVLEVFRSLGKARSWPQLYERLLDRISTLYYALGYDVKGLAMSSVAVLQGCHQYSEPTTGYTAFEAFWQTQRRVLTEKGFGISAHMVVPEVVRSSVSIRRNTYAVDKSTYETTRQLGDVTTSSEWRIMEQPLRRAMLHRLTRHEASASAAAAHGMGSASPLHPQHVQRIVLNLPRGSRGVVRQLANDDVVQLSHTSSVTVNGTAGAIAAGVAGDRFVVTDHLHTRADGAQTAPRFRMYLGEPLKVSVELYNPIGGPLTATHMCLLYVARGKPGPPQLWKTASTQTITIAAQSRARVHLSFDPVQEGEYVLIGLCWTVLSQEGYYYFATRENRPGCTESLFEYAMAHPMPNPDAAENVTVVVESPEAWLTSAFDPPLPVRMRDGEYYHTTLVLQNKSTRGVARHIIMQRSPQNAHLLFFGEFGLEKNLSEEAAFEIAEDLAPGEEKRLSVVFRAQHDRGDTALTCYNHVFLLFGFVSDASSGATAPTTPITTSSVRAIDVRVHRLLRRVEVTPLLLLYSTVLPPVGPSLDTACVLTVKHIPASAKLLSSAVAPGRHAQSLSTAETAAPPVGIARVLVMHEARWHVYLPQHVDTLLQSDTVGATACAVAPGSSLTMPIMVHRVSPDNDGRHDSSAVPVAQESACETFKDTECLPLKRVITSDATAKLVEAALGHGLAQNRDDDGVPVVRAAQTHTSSDANAFFLKTFFRGAGGAGSSTVDRKAGMEAMAFYKDKGASTEAVAAASRTAAERRQAEQRQEAAMYGAPLETYTPIAVAVAWLVEEEADDDDDPGADDDVNAGDKTDVVPSSSKKAQKRVVCGQSFFLIDVMAFLESSLSDTGQSRSGTSRPDGESAVGVSLNGKAVVGLANANLIWESSALPANGSAGSHTDPVLSTGDVATLQEQQRRLSRAFWDHNSPHGERGALVYKLSAPPHAQPSLSMPTAAIASVTLTCLSLSPVPLMVEVSAHDPADTNHHGHAGDHRGTALGKQGPSVAAPILFVGKTQEAFYLPPSARHALTFTVHILAPGVIDCNRLRVRATPLLFQPDVETVRTGMSVWGFLRALRTHDERVNMNAYDSAVVHRRRGSSATAGCALGSDAHASSSAAATQTRAALQSLVAAQSRRRNTVADMSMSAYSPVAASPNTPTHHHEAQKVVVDMALSLLTPRGFLPSHIVVVGTQVQAMVRVDFPRTSTVAQEAAAAVFQRKNTVYHRDWHLFEANHDKFNKAQATAWLDKKVHAEEKQATVARVGDGLSCLEATSPAQPDASGPRVHYVYRPRVKKAVDATGTGPGQRDELDRLFASSLNAAGSESNGSFSGLRRPTASATPPAKGAVAALSARESGQSRGATKPRPPKLSLSETPQPSPQAPPSSLADSDGRTEATAHSVPEALFASPILHAAPPLASAPHRTVSCGADGSAASAHALAEVEADDGRPLPTLSFNDDSEPTSDSTSHVHSTLLSPLHMPSPHRGPCFQHVMPVDSMRDLSEVEVAAAAEGVPSTTNLVHGMAPHALADVDGEDAVDDVLDTYFRQAADPMPQSPASSVRLSQPPAATSQSNTVVTRVVGSDRSGDPVIVYTSTPTSPPRATPVFSRVEEYRANAHPLKAEDVLAADVAQGMPTLSARSAGVVVGVSHSHAQPLVTGTPVRGETRPSTIVRGVSVGSTGGGERRTKTSGSDGGFGDAHSP